MSTEDPPDAITLFTLATAQQLWEADTHPRVRDARDAVRRALERDEDALRAYAVTLDGEVMGNRDLPVPDPEEDREEFLRVMGTRFFDGVTAAIVEAAHSARYEYTRRVLHEALRVIRTDPTMMIRCLRAADEARRLARTNPAIVMVSDESVDPTRCGWCPSTTGEA